MITVKVCGQKDVTRLIGPVIKKALTDLGLKTELWWDVAPKDREPQASARKNKAGALVIEMRARK